jgi:AAA+ ATPase superfamily predicted ATPase
MFEDLMDSFVFPALPRFIDRGDDLTRLEDWWHGTETNALALYGRRRVGKSWLFRRFAHDKPAIVLVADRRAQGPQLDRFAGQLEPLVGVRPALGSVAALIEALYTLAGSERSWSSSTSSRTCFPPNIANATMC